MFKRTHQQINLLLSIRILCSFCVSIRKLCFCQKQWLSTIRNNIMLTWGELYPFSYFREKWEEVYTIRKVHIQDTIGTIFNQWAADTNHTIGSEIWTTIYACDPFNAQTVNQCWLRMLETKCVDDEDVGDGFGHFGHQHPLSFYVSVGHQKSLRCKFPLVACQILKRKY